MSTSPTPPGTPGAHAPPARRRTPANPGRAVATAVAVVALVGSLATTSTAQSADPAPLAADPAPLANMAHLEFLGDVVAPPAQAGHTTYRLSEEPEVGVLWTYADRRDGGVYERVGGGAYDPATDTWGQGAFNADDISRDAVAFLRHWELTGSTSSRDQARQLLRGLTFMQTTTGPNAGNVVLWMQPDGTLNPSADPVELPDPSDSADAYWVARTIWALGEGYATFVDDDPDFAAFLADRMQLSIDAVQREVLGEYGETQVVDGLDWPAWLIADGADASSEAVYGLSAFVQAGGDATVGGEASEVLAQLSEGIAMMQLGTTHDWPYRALIPYVGSRTIWHAWGDQMAGSLAVASQALGDGALLTTARRTVGSFTPHVLAQGGAENGWLPAPSDRTQIAYGADATLQNLLAVADAGGADAFDGLAGLAGAWYFGNNPAGEPMYDPATGRTFDGINPDGVINRNSGAESSIHGILSMLALDAHPDVASWAMVAQRRDHVTWQLVEAESGTWSEGAAVVTPAEAWTGEGLWSGGSYLSLPARASVSIPVNLPTTDRQWLQPVFERHQGIGPLTRVGIDGAAAGVVDQGGAGPPGITPTDGYFDLGGVLSRRVDAGATTVEVRSVRARETARLDAVLVQPALEWLVLADDGAGRGQAVLRSFDQRPRRQAVTLDGADAVTAAAFDALGNPTWSRTAAGDTITVRVEPGGFAVVHGG